MADDDDGELGDFVLSGDMINRLQQRQSHQIQGDDGDELERSGFDLTSGSEKEADHVPVLLSDDDEDSVAKLNVNGPSLDVFARRVLAAGATKTSESNNDEVDVFSSADPFENMTDSDAPMLSSRSASTMPLFIDNANVIHSQAERGEFDIVNLASEFVKAQEDHDAMFGNVLALPRVQTLLAPTSKIIVPEQIQVDFIKQYSVRSSAKQDAGPFIEQYKMMLSSCLEHHFEGLTSASRRKSTGGRRRQRRDGEDGLDDVQLNLNAFLVSLSTSFAELVSRLRTEAVSADLNLQMAQSQSALSAAILDAAARIQAASELSITCLNQRIDSLDQTVSNVERQVANAIKENKSQSSTANVIPKPVHLPRQIEGSSTPNDTEGSSRCRRWLILFVQFAFIVLLIEVIYSNINSFTQSRSRLS